MKINLKCDHVDAVRANWGEGSVSQKETGHGDVENSGGKREKSGGGLFPPPPHPPIGKRQRKKINDVMNQWFEGDLAQTRVKITRGKKRRTFRFRKMLPRRWKCIRIRLHLRDRDKRDDSLADRFGDVSMGSFSKNFPLSTMAGW